MTSEEELVNAFANVFVPSNMRTSDHYCGPLIRPTPKYPYPHAAMKEKAKKKYVQNPYVQSASPLCRKALVPTIMW